MRLDTLLHIYDDNEFGINLSAKTRSIRSMFPPDKIGVSSLPGFLAALDKLVRDGKQYSRCLIETHGGPGSISFGGDYVNASIINSWFTNRSFEKIFPYVGTRIYLNGCNIANDLKDDNNKGLEFLNAVGSVFLKIGGGVVFAQTGVGLVNVFNGHVAHLSGKTHYSNWLPGGVFAGNS